MRASTSVVSALGHRRCTLGHRPAECMSSIFVILKFTRTHLKFTVYSHNQASKQANMHTHMRNAVPLVWGSLRLAPIRYTNFVHVLD